ncbi:hypothetical protein [Sphingobium amiense]|uniref:hypothetical protein n=1 Tax=Sphingobium amiense TaxID=135719 RepID=UPI0008329281|nr:hypothetical protein [Sphingobium amiense]
MQQPDLPNLPPMQSVQAPPAPLAAPAAAPAHDVTRSVPLTRRLRQMVGIVMGGGIGLVAVIAVGQATLKPGYRPTDIASAIEATFELGIMNQKLGAAPGEMVLTEDQYRARIAEAERGGQAKAELAFQKEMAVVQADKERIVGAYQTLYQRTNIIAQAAVQLEALALQFRQRIYEQTNGGRAVIIGIYDAGCALGNPQACESAREARRGMMEEAGELTEGDIARKVNELMAGIPDPATLVAGQDIARRGAPKLPR